MNYYRKHIRDFSTLAAPLYELTKRNATFVWCDEHERSFETLKMRLATSPILAIFDPNNHTILDTDASDTGLGATLSQIVDGKERVVAYASRTLNDAEKRYTVTKREMLAIIFALKQFRKYLLGHTFHLRTDHAPLLHIQTMNNTSAQISRWLEKIQELNFTIEHRPSCLHGNADGLSRRPESPLTSVNVIHSSVGNNHAVGDTSQNADPPISSGNDSNRLDIDWAMEQENDPDIGPIYKALRNSSEPPSRSSIMLYSGITKQFYNMWPMLVLENNILFRRWIATDKSTKWLQMIIPHKLRHAVVSQCHTGMTGGHLGPVKTIHQIQRRAFFNGWRSFTYRFCRQCQECAQCDRGKLKRQGHMQEMLARNVMDRIGIDTVDHSQYLTTECTSY